MTHGSSRGPRVFRSWHIYYWFLGPPCRLHVLDVQPWQAVCGEKQSNSSTSWRSGLPAVGCCDEGLQLSLAILRKCDLFWDGEWKRDPNSKVVNVTSNLGIQLGHVLNHSPGRCFFLFEFDIIQFGDLWGHLSSSPFCLFSLLRVRFSFLGWIFGFNFWYVLWVSGSSPKHQWVCLGLRQMSCLFRKFSVTFVLVAWLVF